METRPARPGAAPAAQQLASSFVSHLVAALRNSLIYTPRHAQVEFSLTQAVEKAREAFLDMPELALVCIEKEILFLGRPMNKLGLHFVKLAEFMHSAGVQRLVFLPGITVEELRAFIQNAAGMDEEGREAETGPLVSTKCLKAGRLAAAGRANEARRISHKALMNLMVRGVLSDEEIEILKAGDEHDSGPAIQETDSEFLEKAREAITDVCTGQAVSRRKMRDSVMGFIHYFLKFADAVFPLDELREHDKLTFNHCVNVSVLCAAQARLIDASPEIFKDIALAGLYHDYGKTRIPAKILNKADPLSAREKRLIAQHSLSGARMLSQQPAIPRIAVVAAYEHHIHYSGKSGYPRSERIHAPCMVSQMVTLADFFDASLTHKPYRPARKVSFVLDLLKKRSGSQFNPHLVNIFGRVVRTLSPSAV